MLSLLPVLLAQQTPPVAQASPAPEAAPCETCPRVINIRVDNRTDMAILSVATARGSSRRARLGAVRGFTQRAVVAPQRWGTLSVRVQPDDPATPCRATLYIELGDGRILKRPGYDLCKSEALVIDARDLDSVTPD